MSEFKKIENAKAEVSCSLEGEEWKAFTDKAYKKVAQKLEIKGFRKGHAPAHIVKEYINMAEVLMQAADNAAQGLLDKAIDEHKIDLIDRPTMKIDEINEDKLAVTFECAVTPDVELCDYKALEYKVDDPNVTDGDIDAEVNRLLQQKAELELKEDGEVEDGDTAVIDFEGFKDGVAFEGGKGENYDLAIGSGSFIPGFEEQLIGMKSEEEKDINVTFPENYHAEELKGAAVVFKVKVHEIKKKVLPELNDEFVSELSYENVTNVAELRDYLKNQLETTRKSQAENLAIDALIDQLTSTSKIDIPEVMINSEIDSLMNEYNQNLMAQGMSFEQFKQITGQTDQDLRNMMKDEAEKRVRTSLCLKEIAKVENITVDDADIAKTYEELSERYSGMDVAIIKKYIPEYQVRENLTVEKALDLLKKN